jgi:4-amino-4-deoxychorismate lyase
MQGPKLLETIRIEDGKIHNLPYHERRMRRALDRFYPSSDIPALSEVLEDYPSKGLYRCRVIYAEDIEKIEYLPYFRQEKKLFAAVEFEGNYEYKYSERKEFEILTQLYPDVDELILCKNGLLTDTTTANIALLKKGKWLTPASPLLEGTTRERLLEEGFLSTADLYIDEIDSFDGFALMNAMIGFIPIKGVKIRKAR